jgi:hypothetical protein
MLMLERPQEEHSLNEETAILYNSGAGRHLHRTTHSRVVAAPAIPPRCRGLENGNHVTPMVETILTALKSQHDLCVKRFVNGRIGFTEELLGIREKS